MTEPEAVLEYSKGSRRDKKPSKPPAIPIHVINNNTFDTPTSSQTMSPLSPVTPAGSCKLNEIFLSFPCPNYPILLVKLLISF